MIVPSNGLDTRRRLSAVRRRASGRTAWNFESLLGPGRACWGGRDRDSALPTEVEAGIWRHRTAFHAVGDSLALCNGNEHSSLGADGRSQHRLSNLVDRCDARPDQRPGRPRDSCHSRDRPRALFARVTEDSSGYYMDCEPARAWRSPYQPVKSVPRK